MVLKLYGLIWAIGIFAVGLWQFWKEKRKTVIRREIIKLFAVLSISTPGKTFCDFKLQCRNQKRLRVEKL